MASPPGPRPLFPYMSGQRTTRTKKGTQSNPLWLAHLSKRSRTPHIQPIYGYIEVLTRPGVASTSDRPALAHPDPHINLPLSTMDQTLTSLHSTTLLPVRKAGAAKFGALCESRPYLKQKIELINNSNVYYIIFYITVEYIKNRTYLTPRCIMFI